MFDKKTLIATVAIAAFIVTGCAVSSTYSEEEIGLRKTNLYSENTTDPAKTSYGKVAAGESKLIDRAFENAPPMIPHDVEGMLPITRENNSCLACHDPMIAEAIKATPTPKSHLASFRPTTTLDANGQIEKEGKLIENTADVKTALHQRDGVSMERFNCSQCHAPQSNNEPLVKNEFSPEFRTENGSHRSNLLDTLNEGVQ